MQQRKKLTSRDAANGVDAPAVIQRYQAAEREYLQSLFDEDDRQVYRNISNALFGNERFRLALEYCDSHQAAFQMIVAVRDIVMKHQSAAERYKVALESSDLFLSMFMGIGKLLRLRRPPPDAGHEAGDSLYNDTVFELLEQAYLKSEEAVSYWAHEADAALRRGGKTSNRGYANRSQKGAIHGATAEALDRVITSSFSTEKKVGRLELIADLMRIVDKNYMGGGREVGNILRNRKRSDNKRGKQTSKKD